MSEFIHDGIFAGSAMRAIFLDVQKAFDKVKHVLLIFKLIKLGVDLQPVKIFHDYHTFRSFIVRVSNSFSITHPVLSSVPQGSLCSAK